MLTNLNKKDKQESLVVYYHVDAVGGSTDVSYDVDAEGGSTGFYLMSTMMLMQ